MAQAHPPFPPPSPVETDTPLLFWLSSLSRDYWRGRFALLSSPKVFAPTFDPNDKVSSYSPCGVVFHLLSSPRSHRAACLGACSFFRPPPRFCTHAAHPDLALALLNRVLFLNELPGQPFQFPSFTWCTPVFLKLPTHALFFLLNHSLVPVGLAFFFFFQSPSSIPTSNCDPSLLPQISPTLQRLCRLVERLPELI